MYQSAKKIEGYLQASSVFIAGTFYKTFVYFCKG